MLRASSPSSFLACQVVGLRACQVVAEAFPDLANGATVHFGRFGCFRRRSLMFSWGIMLREVCSLVFGEMVLE
jgi:hypothetical protein